MVAEHLGPSVHIQLYKVTGEKPCPTGFWKHSEFDFASGAGAAARGDNLAHAEKYTFFQTRGMMLLSSLWCSPIIHAREMRKMLFRNDMIKRRWPLRIRAVLNSFSMSLQRVYVHDVQLYIRISLYFNGRRPHIAALSTFTPAPNTTSLC